MSKEQVKDIGNVDILMIPDEGAVASWDDTIR